MPVPFEPTDDQRRTVRAMAGFGVPQEEIARFLNVDPKTLRKHFRDELDLGVTEANAKVAQSLFNMATQQNNVAAAIFWLKARGGWREKQLDPAVAPERSVVTIVTGVPRHPDFPGFRDEPSDEDDP